jgi:hypothetical protein
VEKYWKGGSAPKFLISCISSTCVDCPKIKSYLYSFAVYLTTNVVWPVKVDGNETLCSAVTQFIAALPLKIANKIYFLSKLNVKTPSRQLEPDSCQIRQHKPNRPIRESHQSLIYISCYQSRQRQNLISLLSASDERRTSTVQRDGHWLL